MPDLAAAGAGGNPPSDENSAAEASLRAAIGLIEAMIARPRVRTARTFLDILGHLADAAGAMCDDLRRGRT